MGDRFEVERIEGRVVGGRPLELKTAEGARAYCDEFRRLITGYPGLTVVCADYREVDVFPPVVMDELQRLMADMNDKLERSAILVARDHATNAMQVARVVRQTENTGRRRFDDPAAMRAWLAEILTPAESDAIERFLAGDAAGD